MTRRWRRGGREPDANARDASGARPPPEQRVCDPGRTHTSHPLQLISPRQAEHQSSTPRATRWSNPRCARLLQRLLDAPRPHRHHASLPSTSRSSICSTAPALMPKSAWRRRCRQRRSLANFWVGEPNADAQRPSLRQLRSLSGQIKGSKRSSSSRRRTPRSCTTPPPTSEGTTSAAVRATRVRRPTRGLHPPPHQCGGRNGAAAAATAGRRRLRGGDAARKGAARRRQAQHLRRRHQIRAPEGGACVADDLRRNEGEALFLPKGWHHAVISVAPERRNIAVNTRYDLQGAGKSVPLSRVSSLDELFQQEGCAAGGRKT